MNSISQRFILINLNRFYKIHAFLTNERLAQDVMCGYKEKASNWQKTIIIWFLKPSLVIKRHPVLSYFMYFEITE